MTHTKTWARSALGAFTLAIVACGCAANARPPLDARSAPGGLDARPAATLTPPELAYGVSQGAEHARPVRVRADELAPYPKTESETAERKPAKRRTRTASAAALPPPPDVVPEPDPATAPEPLAAAPSALDSELQRYAARERQASELQRSAGGDTIVIGTSTLFLVLLIILLIVLLD